MVEPGIWEGPARILGAPGMVEVEVAESEPPEIVITLLPLGLVKQPLTDVVVEGPVIKGRLGHVGDITFRQEANSMTLHWARAGQTMDIDLRPREGSGEGDGPYPYVDAIVVARKGETLREDYYNGTTAEDLHTQQSCTKSITALVFGTAFDRGEIALEDPVWKFFADRPDARWVKEKYDVSVHQLLCMSVGLEWNESVHYTDPRNDNTRMNASGDWIGYVLDRPLADGFPAGRFEYQSGLSILLGAVLRSATGQSVDELARERLFNPIGIDRFEWTKDGDGNPHTGGGLFLRSRDMVALGQVILDKGGDVLSREWIEKATSDQSLHAESGTRYGYKWFLGTLPVGERSFDVIGASGYGGQSLLVLPELDLVVQSNAHDWFGDGRSGKIAAEVVAELI
ncbi:MAG TPA: serine hydrolase [Acidimicrobiales bacterium]|nr:serine hydrolase [Acidimicrobiales bacterium]